MIESILFNSSIFYWGVQTLNVGLRLIWCNPNFHTTTDVQNPGTKTAALRRTTHWCKMPLINLVNPMRAYNDMSVWRQRYTLWGQNAVIAFSVMTFSATAKVMANYVNVGAKILLSSLKRSCEKLYVEIKFNPQKLQSYVVENFKLFSSTPFNFFLIYCTECKEQFHQYINNLISAWSNKIYKVIGNLSSPRQGGLLTVFHTVRRRSYLFSR